MSPSASSHSSSVVLKATWPQPSPALWADYKGPSDSWPVKGTVNDAGCISLRRKVWGSESYWFIFQLSELGRGWDAFCVWMGSIRLIEPVSSSETLLMWGFTEGGTWSRRWNIVAKSSWGLQIIFQSFSSETEQKFWKAKKPVWISYDPKSQIKKDRLFDL